MPIA
jgi:hypothetical protein